MKYFIALLALVAPLSATAANQVSLESTVLVERNAEQADGTVTLTLEEPSRVIPGDNLVFVLRYRNDGAAPAEDFSVTNPMPEAVAFRDTNDAGAVFSVDGGESWGALTQLTVVGEDGVERPASGDDVTHIRWTLAEPIPAGGYGQLTFRGVVR